MCNVMQYHNTILNQNINQPFCACQFIMIDSVHKTDKNLQLFDNNF